MVTTDHSIRANVFHGRIPTVTHVINFANTGVSRASVYSATLNGISDHQHYCISSESYSDSYRGISKIAANWKSYADIRGASCSASEMGMKVVSQRERW